MDVIIAGVLALVLVAVLVARLGGWVLGRRRMVTEMRGDWWSRFEREFHAYAGSAGTAGGGRDSQR